MLVGCCTPVPTNPNWVSDTSAPNNVIYELTIRKNIGKPTGELTKADLEEVTSLYLKNKQLTSVKGLEKCTQLTYLLLGSNQLTDTDVKGLLNLTNLDRLDLDNNQLTDLKGLEKLTKLEVLWIRNNHDITKSQIAELQKALPRCLIEHTATK